MGKQTSVRSGRDVTSADVEEMARSVLRLCSVPFTSVTITALPAGWKVVVYDGTSLIMRLPIPAGPPATVRQAIVDAVDAVW